MSTPNIAIVAGTRPEIVKLAPVYLGLRRDARMNVRWIHTGQHDSMAREMLQCFGIRPDVEFTRDGASLESFSSGCRRQLDAMMQRGRWEACIVQGDTETAFLGALAAFYARVPVAHVEAGLRTHNLQRPFPEEGLRQMISRVASMHFAPTQRARDQLLHEGIDAGRIVVTGNTVVDAQQWISGTYNLVRGDAARQGHILVTAHRREHWGGDMEQIFGAIADIASAYPSIRILFPVHLNPVVQKPARCILGGLSNVHLVAPLDYLGMQRALVGARLLLTDSGGLQEEAPTFGVPTLVLRRETERPEAVEAGCALLVGSDRADIVREAKRLLDDPATAASMSTASNPFGDGHASARIARTLERMLGLPAAPDRDAAPSQTLIRVLQGLQSRSLVAPRQFVHETQTTGVA